MTAPPSQTYGYLAEFRSAAALLEAVRRTRAAGYTAIEAYSPMHIEGMHEALALRPSRLPRAVLAGALLGAIGFYALEYYSAVIDYPLNIGSRPASWPALLFPAVEVTLLCGALCGVLGMLVANGLPRLYHPLFGVPAFDGASRDRFFLCIRDHDARRFLETLVPVAIVEVRE